MARRDLPFEVGAKVAEGRFNILLNKREYPDRGWIVAGYTYWKDGFSILTVDPDGNEREHMQGGGLYLCSK